MKYAEKDTYVVLFLQTPYLLIVGSLVPLFGGAVLASLTEVSFNWLVIIFPFLKFQSQMIGECITLSISSVKLTLLAIELSLIFICLYHSKLSKMRSDVLIFEETVIMLQAYTSLAMRKKLIIPFPVILAKIMEHILFYFICNLKPWLYFSLWQLVYFLWSILEQMMDCWL